MAKARRIFLSAAWAFSVQGVGSLDLYVYGNAHDQEDGGGLVFARNLRIDEHDFAYKLKLIDNAATRAHTIMLRPLELLTAREPDYARRRALR